MMTHMARMNDSYFISEKKDALNKIGKMADQKQQLSASELRRTTESIQKIINSEHEKVLIVALQIIPKLLSVYANEPPMKDWLYSLLTGKTIGIICD